MSKENKVAHDENYEAYLAAQADMAEEHLVTFKENSLEDYIDDVKATKDDVFYRPSDGRFETSWKRLLKNLNKV